MFVIRLALRLFTPPLGVLSKCIVGMHMIMCVYVFMFVCVCACVCIYLYNVCGIMLVVCLCEGVLVYCVCMGVYLCIYVYVCLRVFVCVLQRLRTRSCDSKSIIKDLDWCSLWIRYTGDSKTDPWDDPEIHTVSCSEDQTTIQFQNHVISCDTYLLLSVVLYDYSYNFMWAFGLF